MAGYLYGFYRRTQKNAVLVVIDRFTKYSHFLPLKHPFTAQDVAELFLKEIYRLHGIPKSIVSDRDPVFTSDFWQHLFRSMGTKLNLSLAYHPKSYGQMERLNRCMETYLRVMAFDNPKQWVKWLHMAEWWYNTNYHSALKITTFEALYGYAPPELPLGSLPSSGQTMASMSLAQRQHMVQTLKDNLIRAQSRMKFFADRSRSERTLEIGDQVYLKLQPYRQSSIEVRKNVKFVCSLYWSLQDIEENWNSSLPIGAS